MAFATKYRILFDDVDSLAWDILLQEDGWGGGITDLTPGQTPAILKHNQTDRYQTIVGASLDMQVVYESAVDDLYTEVSQEIKVILRRNTTAIFTGWLLPGQYTRHFNTPKHYVMLTASDGLGELKDIRFEDGSGDPYHFWQTEITVISNVLQKTGLQVNILDAVNIFEDGYTAATTDSPFLQTYIQPEQFWDEETDQRMDCYTVLTSILKKYGATVRQSSNIWYITRPNSYIANSIKYRIFTYAGAYSSNSIFTSFKAVGSDMFYIHNAELTKLRGIGSCEITADPPRRDNIIKNGSFDAFTWDGSDFDYWTASGSPGIASDNNMLKMDSANSGSAPTKYIEATVNLHNPTSIELNLDWTPTFSGAPTFKNLLIQIYDGAEYLVGSVKLGTPAWQGSASFVSIVAGSTGVEEHITLDFPDTVTGGGFDRGMSLRIRVYEFNNENTVGTNYLHLNNLRLKVQSDSPDTRLFTFDNPITINNTLRDTISSCDSWRADYFPAGTVDDEFWVTAYSGSYLTTDEWYIRGDNTTVTTPVPVASLLAKQMVEGFAHSVEVISATFRTALTGREIFSIRDSNFTDAYGFQKSHLPKGVSFNVHRAEWEGDWAEVVATYNDTALDWSSHGYGGLGVITGSSIEINNFTITAGLEVATFESYTAVITEVLRLVITLTDDNNSSLPTMTLDGDDLSVTWGENLVEFTCDTAGAKVLLLTGLENDSFELTCNVDFYNLTGI